MKKKLTAAGAAAAAVILVFAVFMLVSRGQSVIKSECELYFLNESGSTLVAEKRMIHYHNEYDLRTAVIDELISGPKEVRNKPVINRRTKLLSVEQAEEGSVVADFSSGFMSGDTAKDVLSAYAVAKTLCGLEGVERVKVTVEKNDIPTAEGKPIGFLSNEDINLSTDTNTSETREVVLYFADKEKKHLIPETRTIKVTDQQPLAQYIINELIKGAELPEHYDTLDPETILIGVNITDNICFVNMSSNFISKNGGSKEKELTVVYSIVNSLTELNTIGRVQFLVDGKRADKFGNISFGAPFERDTTLIGEEG